MDYTLYNIPAFSERIENLPMQTKKGAGVQKLFLTFSERIETLLIQIKRDSCAVALPISNDGLKEYR